MFAIRLLDELVTSLANDGHVVGKKKLMARMLRVLLKHRSMTTQAETLLLCLLRHVASVPFTTTLPSLRALSSTHLANIDSATNIVLPTLPYLTKTWSTPWLEPWTAFCEAKASAASARDAATGLFAPWYIVLIPVDVFCVKTMEMQLANIIRRRGGNGTVLALVEMRHAVARDDLGARRLAVVCADAARARRVVTCPRHVGAFDVYRPDWLVESDLKNKIMCSRVHAWPGGIETPLAKAPVSDNFEAEKLVLESRASTRLSLILTADSKLATPQGLARVGGVSKVLEFVGEKSGGGEYAVEKVAEEVVEEKDRLKTGEKRGKGVAGIVGGPSRKRRRVDVSKFFCQQAGEDRARNLEDFPNNNLICEALTQLATHWELNNKSVPNASFKVRGYRAAVGFVGKLDYDLTTVQECTALVNDKSARSIGDGIGARLQEIVQFGELQEASALKNSPAFTVMRELCHVWGVGPVKAGRLITQGIKCVKDLRAAVRKDPTVLDRQQTIGLVRYEDLLERIPRAEVVQIEEYVRRRVNEIAPDGVVSVKVAGSYLRGASSCGDVDLMLSGNIKTVSAVLRGLVDRMAKDGVLTDALVYGRKKFFGVFQLKPGMRHRRLDLFAVPKEEYAYALLTYTGSGIFNRSMRCLAGRQGFSLSHQGMYKATRHKDGKTKLGAPIACATEKDIFDYLGMKYVEPPDRAKSR